MDKERLKETQEENNMSRLADEIEIDIDEFIACNRSLDSVLMQEESEKTKKQYFDLMRSALSNKEYQKAFNSSMELRRVCYGEYKDEIDDCVELCAKHDIEGAWILKAVEFMDQNTGRIEPGAFMYLKKLSEVGYIKSFRWLADCYYYGLGCEQDLEKADALYLEAVLFDNCEYSAKKYKEMNSWILDCKRDDVLGKLFSCLVCQNTSHSDKARAKIGEMILDGELEVYESETAYYLLKKSLNNSEDGVAYLRLGECEMFGVGTDSDPIIAKELLDKAIRKLESPSLYDIKESFHEELDFEELLKKTKELRTRAKQRIDELNEWDVMQDHEGISDPEIIYYNWESRLSKHIKRKNQTRVHDTDYFSDYILDHFFDRIENEKQREHEVLTVNNFVSHIDQKYTYDDISEITDEYIKIADTVIEYEDCRVDWRYSCDPALKGRTCIGERNSLTNPKYMKFEVGKTVIVILFYQSDDFYVFLEDLRRHGCDMFDLS